MTGTMENGIPGRTYLAQLAVYDGTSYIFLTDDNAKQTFVLDSPSGIASPTVRPSSASQCYDLSGRRINPAKHHATVVIERTGIKLPLKNTY